MKNTIIGEPLPNIPWQERPQGCTDVVWRYDKNPVIGTDALNGLRVFNSAVIPYKGEFIGVFRADHRNGYPNLHLGRSKDAINWDIEEEIIKFVKQRVASYKAVREVEFRKELPLTLVGKVLKRVLQEEERKKSKAL